MREGWQTAILGDVTSFKGGGTPSKSVAAYWNGDVPWVSPKDMKSDVISSSTDSITRDAVDNSAASLIPKGSILIVVRSGILARTVPTGITARELTVNQDIKALCPNSNLDKNFLRCFMLSKEREILKLVTRGATVHRLATDSLKNIKIPLPPLTEQKRIVAILDEVFAGIDRATANAEKNLENAKELFESYLNEVFTKKGEGWVEKTLDEICIEFGRGKSKHRPRNDPSLYGGAYPFIQTGDISKADHVILAHMQTYSEVGLAQSRLWPKGTICLAIVGATIGETGVLDFEACFPDSVIGMIVDPKEADTFCIEYMLQHFKETIKDKGKGSARHNINLGTFKGHKFPIPPIVVQKEVVFNLDRLSEETKTLEAIYQKKLKDLTELKQSILQKAFSGELTDRSSARMATHRWPDKSEMNPTDLHAGIIAIAFQKHEQRHQTKTFGHVKAEKIVHMVEARTALDFGRMPIKDAAGPNDFGRLKKVEHRAKMSGFFGFKRSNGSYQLRKYKHFDELVSRARSAIGNETDRVEEIVDLMVPMNTQQAEVFATVYAAWNNLLIEGRPVSDEVIVREAREDWHTDKLEIPRENFFKALRWIEEKGIVPDGRGKLVGAYRFP